MKVKEFKIRETGVSLRVDVAENFIDRFFGLMGKKNLPSGRGLFLAPCNSIHMFFMRFSIDAIYLDKNFKIKKIVRNLPTWRGLSICFGAYGVLEVSAGDADKFNFKVGQTFDIK